MIGGSLAASIGSYVFDPWMPKDTGIAQELWRVDDFASDALPMRLASSNSLVAMINGNYEGIGNCAVTTVSLTFMRIHSYAVNQRKTNWKSRAFYTWASMLWFTSFHTSGSTMMTNKRNMVLETVGVMFLVSRSDVKHSRRCISEGDEHFYGFWRMMLREFNMEQLIRIVDRTNIRLAAMFAENLVILRSNTTFRGYQQTFSEFLSPLQAGSDSVTGGPVDAGLDTLAVTQLWEEVQGVILAANAWMSIVSSLFGVVDGNGLSPFAIDMATPAQLRTTIDVFFSRTQQDPRGRQALSSGDGGFGLISTMEVEEDKEDEGELSDDDSRDVVDADQSGESIYLPAGIIEHHVSEIRAAAEENVDDVEFVDTLSGEENEEVGIESFFDAVDDIGAWNAFKDLLNNNIGNVS